MVEANSPRNASITKPKQVEETKRRYLGLGSTGYTGVDSVEWDADELPNIVDYD
jgi:hypothetical protein